MIKKDQPNLMQAMTNCQFNFNYLFGFFMAAKIFASPALQIVMMSCFNLKPTCLPLLSFKLFTPLREARFHAG